MPPSKSGPTSAMRFFIEWWEGQNADYECGNSLPPYYSSQFDLGDPEGRPCVAEHLMDRMVQSDSGISAVLDKMAHTQFLFNDGSAIEFDKADKWWRVSGELKMMESNEYAYNTITGKIEARDRVRADSPWPPGSGVGVEHG